MKKEDFKKILAKLNNPDTASEAIVELNDAAEDIFTNIDTMTEELKNANSRVGELRETCGKLAMRITGTEPEPETEKTQEELEQESKDFFINMEG